jgi:hypothetical protein
MLENTMVLVGAAILESLTENTMVLMGTTILESLIADPL